jgi:hypothetical protein
MFGQQRHLFLRKTDYDVFVGKDISTGFPDVAADIQACAFVNGYTFTGSLIGDPSRKKPQLERLLRNDEAWAMCFRKPVPGWRLLGRFAAKNVFVGLSLNDRITMNGGERYNRFAIDMISEWETSYSDLPVVSGQSWSDYVGGKVRDVDDNATWG